MFTCKQKGSKTKSITNAETVVGYWLGLKGFVTIHHIDHNVGVASVFPSAVTSCIRVPEGGLFSPVVHL